MFLVGLNPYGLCCTFGLMGQGTDRGAPNPCGLDDFVALAEQIGARCLELDFRFLQIASRHGLRERLHEKAIVPIVSTGPPTDQMAQVIDAAREIGAKLIRMSLTNVLCGDRAGRPDWDELLSSTRQNLREWAPRAAENGIDFAIENHQDLTSNELLEIAESAGPNVGICFDTGNPLAVGENILDFAGRVAAKVRHVHLKDYRAQFTNEGYRLIRCPIGDGCVPFQGIEQILAGCHSQMTASLEPGALEARHVRLFTDSWWTGYPPRSARELGAAIHTARRNRFAEDEEYRTPWELDKTGAEIVAYERQVLDRSVENMKKMGWL